MLLAWTRYICNICGIEMIIWMLWLWYTCHLVVSECIKTCVSFLELLDGSKLYTLMEPVISLINAAINGDVMDWWWFCVYIRLLNMSNLPKSWHTPVAQLTDGCTSHGVNLMPELKLMVNSNSRIGIEYFKKWN